MKLCDESNKLTRMFFCPQLGGPSTQIQGLVQVQAQVPDGAQPEDALWS